jgi:hypothetical protein
VIVFLLWAIVLILFWPLALLLAFGWLALLITPARPENHRLRTEGERFRCRWWREDRAVNVQPVRAS